MTKDTTLIENEHLKNRGRDKGFTLIEIIIAIAILAIGIVAVLQAFPSGLHLAKVSQMTTVASHLAQAGLEEALAKSYQSVSVSTTTEDYGEIANFSSYKRITVINCVSPIDLSAGSCDYDLVNDPYPMKKIEVTVYWRSPFVTEKNVSLISLISKK